MKEKREMSLNRDRRLELLEKVLTDELTVVDLVNTIVELEAKASDLNAKLREGQRA